MGWLVIPLYIWKLLQLSYYIEMFLFRIMLYIPIIHGEILYISLHQLSEFITLTYENRCNTIYIIEQENIPFKTIILSIFLILGLIFRVSQCVHLFRYC